MSDLNLYPQAFLPIRQRIRAVVTMILDGERAEAGMAGLADTEFAEGALNTLLGIAASLACALIFPGDDPASTDGRARVERVHRALAQAGITALAQEKGGTGER
jgi:hypothetical protein